MDCKKIIKTFVLINFLVFSFSFVSFADGTGQVVVVPDISRTVDKVASRVVTTTSPGSVEPAGKSQMTVSETSVTTELFQVPDMTVGSSYVVRFKFRFSGFVSGTIGWVDNNNNNIYLGWQYDVYLKNGGKVVQDEIVTGSFSNYTDYVDVDFQMTGLQPDVTSPPALYVKISPVVAPWASFPAYTTTSYYNTQKINYSQAVSFVDISYEKLVDADNLLEETKKQTGIMEEQTETSKSILSSITDFFGSFFDNLREFIVGLLIPSGDDITEFLQEVNDWFSARLGFIWYPFDLAIKLVSAFASGDADNTFNVPALTLSLLGDNYQIWEPIEVDLDAFGIFQYVRYFTSVLLVSGVVTMAIHKWDEWIGGHGV